MPKKLVTYACDQCDGQFESRDEALACEANHLPLRKAQIIPQQYLVGEAAPEMLKLCWPNGRSTGFDYTATYKRVG